MIIAAAVLACFTLAANAALDTYALTQHVQVLDVSATDAASSNLLQTITGPAVDTINCKGNGTIVASIGKPLQSNTNFIGTLVIQSSATGTSSWSAVSNKSVTVTGNATGTVNRIAYEFGAGARYIRAVFTTTNDAAGVCVTLNSFKF